MGRRLAREASPTRRSRVGTGSADNDDVDYDDYDDEDEVDDEEEDEVEERPTRRRSNRTPEPETRRRRTSRAEPEEKERPRFRKASDRDEKPSRERPKRPEGVIGKVMSAYKAEAAKRSSGYRTLDVPEGGRKRKLIKFLEPEPFANIYQHWVLQANGKRRPFVCLGEDCPLCGVGDVAKPMLLWNVVDMEDGLVKVWQMSKDPSKRVE